MYGLDLPCYEGSTCSVAAVGNSMDLVVVVVDFGGTTCYGNGSRNQSTSEAMKCKKRNMNNARCRLTIQFPLACTREPDFNASGSITKRV